MQTINLHEYTGHRQSCYCKIKKRFSHTVQSSKWWGSPRILQYNTNVTPDMQIHFIGVFWVQDKTIITIFHKTIFGSWMEVMFLFNFFSFNSSKYFNTSKRHTLSNCFTEDFSTSHLTPAIASSYFLSSRIFNSAKPKKSQIVFFATLASRNASANGLSACLLQMDKTCMYLAGTPARLYTLKREVGPQFVLTHNIHLPNHTYSWYRGGTRWPSYL